MVVGIRRPGSQPIRSRPIIRCKPGANPSPLLSLLLVLSLACHPPALANKFDLPDLGDTTSGIISSQQEHELGRAWLGAFRSRVDTLDDPQLQMYLENLLFDLARHSELQDHRLELVIVNNPTMNAFAVPGGIIGVHTGLFDFAENEHQFASVLSHELAHLSQRHFARRLENQKTSAIGTMAGILTGVILAATVGGDAGMAAMSMTQAAALENALRYSRQNEQEADRIGIRTLHESGRDPEAVAAMFERMLAATRYTGQRPPEFLLTHPLTEKRVADARNRASNYPDRQYPHRPEFDYMEARALLHLENNPRLAVRRFRDEMEGKKLDSNAATYGLALALGRQGDHEQARETLNSLLRAQPDNLILQLATVELAILRGDNQGALERIESLEGLHANNYALRRFKARALEDEARYQAAERVLEKLSRDRPGDPEVWFQLAEVSGLAGDIVGVHKARAEYYILTGSYSRAREQLRYAKRLVQGEFRHTAVLDKRIEDVEALMERAEKL